MTIDVPAELGRGVVVSAGAPAPEPWAECLRVTVGAAELADPDATVEMLHRAWLDRQPVVVELAVGAEALRAPERYDGAPYGLDPSFEFRRERLHVLVWANTYDARSGEPVWWHGRKAVRRWAAHGVSEGSASDLVLADGSPAFVDGGPSHPPVLPDGTAVIHRWNAERGALRQASHDAPSADLATDQLAAVTHASGPARVIAPAGSGKTRVLTERLRHLVVDRGIHPAAITVLAYNAKAAEEAKQRCSDFLSPSGPSIRTLNSLGLAICNAHEASGRLTVLDEISVRDVIQQVFEVRRQANTDTVAPYIDALAAVRLGLSTPEAVEEAVPDAAGLADRFDRYRQALVEAGAVDFDEQIYRAIEILLTDPDARARAQESCRYLLVDEFQDLTPAHVLLIRLLSAPGYDCFGVGDDDQVIYGYSGADPRFLLEFGRFFPGAAEHALEVNYRCPPAVVDAACHLLSYNHRRIPKAIRAADPADPAHPSDSSAAGVSALIVRREPADQLATVAVDLLESWRNGGIALDDIAVLSRVNSALLPVQVACTEAGLPCTTPLGPEVLNRTGVRTALAYLRIGLDPDHISASDIRETIRRPSRGIAPQVADMLTKSSGTSLADIRRLAGRLSGRDVPKLHVYADSIQLLADACRRSTAEALRAIRVDVGLGGTMDVLDSSRREADRSTHADDLVALESVAELHPDVATFGSWLRATLGRSQPEGARVLLSTVHRIKGREWDNVVVFGASQGSFPHRLSEDDEGERRVFHVAITRGKRQVVVLAASEAPSIFVDELDGSRSHAPSRPEPRRAAAAAAAGSKAANTPAARNSATGGGSAVEEALRVWRRTAATAGNVPAYVVLNNRELTGVAERAPRTLAQLAACPGIGSIRLERYGDEILSVIESALDARM